MQCDKNQRFHYSILCPELLQEFYKKRQFLRFADCRVFLLPPTGNFDRTFENKHSIIQMAFSGCRQSKQKATAVRQRLSKSILFNQVCVHNFPIERRMHIGKIPFPIGWIEPVRNILSHLLEILFLTVDYFALKGQRELYKSRR